MRVQTNYTVIAELQAALQTRMAEICPPYIHTVQIDVCAACRIEQNRNTCDEYSLLPVFSVFHARKPVVFLASLRHQINLLFLLLVFKIILTRRVKKKMQQTDSE